MLLCGVHFIDAVHATCVRKSDLSRSRNPEASTDREPLRY